MSYYVDTCVYLNLWKKEESMKKDPWWFFAKKFFEEVQNNTEKIYYSGFILKELLFILSTEEYLEKRNFFFDIPCFEKVNLSEEEYIQAQQLKGKNSTNCSLFDIIHIILARKTKSTLITRDNELIVLAKSLGVEAKRPEEITKN